jgi:Fe-S cluster assembly protein SufD
VSEVRAIAKNAAEAAFEAAFRTGRRSPEAAEAFRRFEAAGGVPSRRMESWHYTDLRRVLAAPAPFAPQPDSVRIAEVKSWLDDAPRHGATRLVLVDGRFAPELSDSAPEGATLTGGAPALHLGEREDAMLALAGAFAEGGLSFDVRAGVDAGRVEIVHVLRSGVASASHLRFVFQPEARGVIVERTVGASRGSQRHRVASLELSRGAHVEHAAIVEDDADIEIESLRVTLQEGAAFSSFGLMTGGALKRRQIFARLEGRDASLTLSGLSLIDGARHADTTLEVTHAAPHGKSREFFRHIVADSGVGVYQGKVIVAQHAQKTDGAMKSQALLLSPTAQMDNKPELEIFADDVVCGHGATVGALDPEQIFYLRSRGLPKPEAEAMLLEAFGVEAIDRVADEALAAALRERLQAWLKGRAA